MASFLCPESCTCAAHVDGKSREVPENTKAPIRQHVLAKHVTKVLTADEIDPYAIYYMPGFELTGKEVLTTILQSFWYLLRQTPYPSSVVVFRDNARSVRKDYKKLEEKNIPVAQGVGKRPPTYNSMITLEDTELNTLRRSTRVKRAVKELSGQQSDFGHSGDEEDQAQETSRDQSPSEIGEFEESEQSKDSKNPDELASDEEDEVRPTKLRRLARSSSIRGKNTTRSNSESKPKRKPTCALSSDFISDDDDNDDNDVGDDDGEYEHPAPESRKRKLKTTNTNLQPQPSQSPGGRLRSCVGCRFHKKGACTGQKTASRVSGEACKPCKSRGGNYIQWCANDTWPQHMRAKAR